MDTQQAINRHGAAVVYEAAAQAIEGRGHSGLEHVGLHGADMLDTWSIMVTARRQLTAAQKAAEQTTAMPWEAQA